MRGCRNGERYFFIASSREDGDLGRLPYKHPFGHRAKMTTSIFKHIDTNSYTEKPWTKVDGPGKSYKQLDYQRQVINIRGKENEFTTDNSGFAVFNEPAKEKLFVDDAAVRNEYYKEVEELLKKTQPGVKKVVIFE